MIFSRPICQTAMQVISRIQQSILKTVRVSKHGPLPSILKKLPKLANMLVCEQIESWDRILNFEEMILNSF